MFFTAQLLTKHSLSRLSGVADNYVKKSKNYIMKIDQDKYNFV